MKRRSRSLSGAAKWARRNVAGSSAQTGVLTRPKGDDAAGDESDGRSGLISHALKLVEDRGVCCISRSMIKTKAP